MAAVYRVRKEEAAILGSTVPISGQKNDLKRLENLLAEVKLYMAQETSNGEHFLVPLAQMRTILESVMLQKHTKDLMGMASRGVQNTLYALAVENLPKLISYTPRIKTAKQEMGVVLLDVLCYLMAVEGESLLTFLPTFSSSLLYLPCPEWPEACQEIVSRLCHYALPTCLVQTSSFLPPPLTTSSSLMIVLDTCSNKHHLMMADTLMYLKRDVCTDILSLIAYGTPGVRQKALKLLLHYWPLPIPEFSRYVSPYGEWLTLNCENADCRHGTARASVLCLDAPCVSQHKNAGQHAKLFMLLCQECDSLIHQNVADSDEDHFKLHFPQPLRDVKPNCEFQKMCSGKDQHVNKAEVTCYDGHCTAIQGGQPIRMCRDCHNKQHGDIEDPRHIFQIGPPNPWDSNDLMSSAAMLEAVSKLLETPPTLHAPPRVTVGRAHHMIVGLQLQYQLKVEGCREGIWLLVHYCTPTDFVRPAQQDWMVHLVALVLEWLQAYQDILKQVEVELSPSVNEDTDTPSPDVTEYLKYFSNHADISSLVDSFLIPWLCDVTKTNDECVVEAMLPSLKPCAQVGKLWAKNHDPIKRYQRTLGYLYRFYLLFKSGQIPQDDFMKVYNSVMPEWLDLLVQLRTEPGKMVELHTCYHRLLTHPFPEGKLMMDFVWDSFRGRGASAKRMQKALFWLQDLTRLKISLPYLPHMFESAVTRRGRAGRQQETKMSASSFDQEVEERRDSIERERKESTGSMSGNESESALVSQSSFEEPETQAIVSLNSSLTRSILMLDIWLSQMQLGTLTLSYNTLLNLLVKMLQSPWGSSHTYQDHHDTTNTCLLCKATSLWFSLVTKLLEENEQRQRAMEEEEATDLPSPTGERPSHVQLQRSSVRKLALKIRKLTHSESPEDLSPTFASLPTKLGSILEKKGLEESRHLSLGSDGGKGQGVEQTDFDRDFPPAEPKRKRQFRKMGTSGSRSDYQVTERPSSEVLPALQEEEEGEEEEEEERVTDVSTIYKVFQLCRDHLKPKLHPEAIHKIVQCLSVLVRRSQVLQCVEGRMGWTEVRQLFKDLWRCIDGQSSFVARSCVALLLDCVYFLSDHELSQGLEQTTCWTTFTQGLRTDKFKSVEKFCIFLQFMKSSEVALDWHEPTPSITAIKVTVGYSFCLAVQLLQDKSSNVTSRAHYCLCSLTNPAVEALRGFVLKLFVDYPLHRSLVLHSLSLLNSSLPELNFLSVDFLGHILAMLTPHSSPLPHHREPVSKKVSAASDVSSATPKASVTSYLPSPATPFSVLPATDSHGVDGELLQLALSLLLKYIANPKSDSTESLRKSSWDKLQRRAATRARETSTEPEMRLLSHLKSYVCSNFHQDPATLRASPVFEVFLNHIYPVLDHNVAFCTTPGLLTFLLKLLVFSAAPAHEEEFIRSLLQSQSQRKEWKRCEFGLGSLPPGLRAPWLRVFFVVLYKYIHLYQDPADQQLIYLCRCCLEICLCTVEAAPHTCTLLASPAHATAPQKSAPFLKRQHPVESSTTSVSASVQTFPAYISLELTPPPASDTPLEEHGGAGEGRGGGGGGGDARREPHALSPVPEETETVRAHKSRSAQPAPHSTLQPTHSGSSVGSQGSESSAGAASTFLSPHSNPPLHAGLCSVCGRVTNEFSEEVISQCAIAMGTCCHRLPTHISGYLVSRIIPALAKVIIAGSYPWQRSSEEPPPGSATAVSRNLLKSVLTQFADRRLFLFLFNHDHGQKAETVFPAVGSSLPDPPLGEGEGGEGDDGMTMASPVTYFLQDAVTSQNFSQDIRPLSLLHLALYVEKTPLSVSTMFKHIAVLDGFCKKLKTTNLLRNAKAVYGFLRVIIQVLTSVPHNMPLSTLRSPPIQSFSQSLLACLEVALHHVYCPVGGLVQLAGIWYHTFLTSPRDCGKIALLYITELRKALKSHPSSEVAQYGTFLSLTQVMLLEENGYLGYVDSLTEERVYAHLLKEEYDYEDFCLAVLQDVQWDCVDALLFLDSSGHRWPRQELPRLKLLIAQLLSLRVQHGRSPVEQLRRLVNEDLRPITLSSSKSGQRVAPRWQDYLSALHIFAWLLLGAMCHNAVHQVASTETESIVGGRCQLLGSLDTRMEAITSGVIWLTRGAMQGIKSVHEPTSSSCQYLIFTFAAIWTGYMELYERDSVAVIVSFWESFVSNMVTLLSDFSIVDETRRREVVHTINDRIIIPLKKVGLSCYTLLLPIWRELSKELIADRFLVFPDIPSSTTTIPLDMWFKEMIVELVTVEGESDSQATTAL